jgi:hypothetical protein
MRRQRITSDADLAGDGTAARTWTNRRAIGAIADFSDFTESAPNRGLDGTLDASDRSTE